MLAISITILIFALAIGVTLVLVRRLSGTAEAERQAPPDPRVDIGALDSTGPTADGPQLEFYGTRVRVAVFVIAPVGRDQVVPPKEKLPEVVEHLVPGLMQVLAAHQPIYREWSAQLSSQGFTQAFHNKLALPGDRGKGTPWCGIAGKFEWGDQQLLAGLICTAGRGNGLAEVTVEHAGQWHDILRVRS